jgi:hypothetical protein
MRQGKVILVSGLLFLTVETILLVRNQFLGGLGGGGGDENVFGLDAILFRHLEYAIYQLYRNRLITPSLTPK